MRGGGRPKFSLCLRPCRGYGGHGQGRSGQDTRMKRDFDRKSCDGIKAVDKKEGSGSHKWGTFEDEMKAKDDKAFTSEADPKEATNTPAGPASPTAEDEEALAQKAAEEEEANMMTLDQWKAQRAKKEGPTFNLRKAGEGYENDPKWKKTYAYNKDVLTQEDEEYEDYELYPQRSNRQKKILDIQFSFNNPGGHPDGRPSEGGRIFGGKPLGGQGAEAPNVNDESSFPSLG